MGEKNFCQFMDLNHTEPNYRRLYSVEAKVCNDLLDMIEKILKYQDKYLKLVGPTVAKLDLFPLKKSADVDKIYDPFYAESKPVDLRKYYEQKLTHITDYDVAFTVTAGELDGLEIYLKSFDVLKGLTVRKRENKQSSAELSMVTGVVLKKDQQRFQKTMLRLSRGNAVVYFKELGSARYDEYIIFVLLFVGAEGGILHQRCTKSATSFEKAKIFNIPEYEDEQVSVYQEKSKELEYKRMLYNKSVNMILVELRECTKVLSVDCSSILMDQAFLNKQKGIFETMNKYHVSGSSLIAECWVPELFLKDLYELVELKNYGNVNFVNKLVQGEMKVLTQNVSEQEKCELNPPSYFRQNPATEIMQIITDTYGIPRYKEINPTLFNVITFPFQFGVMFGDIFHGTLMFVIGIAVCLLDSKLQIGAFKWMLLQMGFWAMFMGYVYNDFTGLSLDIFGSCYSEAEGLFVKTPDCTYPFGFDPVWSKSNEEIAFFNSYKMKLAVLIGVVQMAFGVMLKGCNNVFYRQWVDLFFEFIPQLLFLTLLFGWMDAMIIIKWAVQGTDTGKENLITAMINLVLQMGSSDPDTAVLNVDTQTGIQRAVLIISLLSVPIMLLAKPILLSGAEHPKLQGLSCIYPLVKDEHPHTFSELFVHQMIETIEFALGCVSNTASYLRLWALSLAHSQLSLVFFNYLFKATLGSNFFVIALGFIVFMSVTIGVLMCMDSLECFLHALRLHWVEFQSKFYKADGHKFKPYNHDDYLKQ